MKSGRRLLTLLTVLFPLILFVMGGCSTDAGSGDDGGGTTTDVTISAISVTASPMTINPGGVTTVEAVAYDASGNYMSGVDISFSIDDPTLAAVTASARTDSSGVAEAMVTARNIAGEVEVTASSGDVSDAISISISNSSIPDSIGLTITPASILIQGTASVQAEVLDENGDPVSDGTLVSFSVDNTLYGGFSSATATTTNGLATATFQASSEQGTAAITVQAGDVSAFADIVIYPAEATSVQFVSADPQRIALQGSGGTETSVVQFIVKDSNGNPVEGIRVSFSMTGPNGGEAIDHTPDDETPDEIDVSSNASGIAQVILSSGSVAGPVTIQATIVATDAQGNEIEIVSQSSVISIGGGVPSARRFSVSASVQNLPGLEYNNLETSITAYLADRFGNYNVLEGTSVSFVCELGLAIDTSEVTIDENGLATAVARTQAPAGSDTVAEDVAPDAWETALLSYIDTTYGEILPGHPRDGLSSVMIYVKGEEHFEDENANGIYDLGEGFTDTEDDPFVDYNDDELRDDGTLDPFEEYIDSNGDGTWDGLNGVWDSDKNIFYNYKILLTGEPYLIASSVPSFDILNGDYLDFSIIVCDQNGNMLSPGTKVSVSTSGGTLIGTTSIELADTNTLWPLELALRLVDDNAGDTNPPESIYITVKCEWEGIDYEVIVAAGTLD